MINYMQMQGLWCIDVQQEDKLQQDIQPDAMSWCTRLLEHSAGPLMAMLVEYVVIDITLAFNWWIMEDCEILS